MSANADLWALMTGPHPFEERVLLPGIAGSYCFFCDGVESDPIHRPLPSNRQFGGTVTTCSYDGCDYDESSHRISLVERFWPKVNKSDGCWIWMASLDGKGYGQINAGGKGGHPLRAHRVAYELVIGPIPEGMQLDHLCHNRRLRDRRRRLKEAS